VFLRKKRNKSGSTSVQVISKEKGAYKVLRTVGCASTPLEVELLFEKGRQIILEMRGQTELFIQENDVLIESFLRQLKNSQVRTVGPELVFGKIYDGIGFGKVKEDLFRHLVIARLSFPLSKLKTVSYLYRFQGLSIGIDRIYRFLDKLSNQLKNQVEQIAFQHTLKILGGRITMAFYDLTTLHFEASDEDDLRKTGFSKAGKHRNPQILLGLLVGPGGHPIGYDIFEGNTHEGDTLIPFIEQMSKKFD
jgi:hypothetical protein